MITMFKGQYEFLSNFFYAPFTVDGIEYRTVEHAFQAAKTDNTEDAELIRNTDTPGEAKRLGRQVALRHSWDKIRIGVMYNLVRAKFLQHHDLAELLISTGTEELVEGNWWGDTFWGVHNGSGENHLGKILMKLRVHFRRYK